MALTLKNYFQPKETFPSLFEFRRKSNASSFYIAMKGDTLCCLNCHYVSYAIIGAIIPVKELIGEAWKVGWFPLCLLVTKTVVVGVIVTKRRVLIVRELDLFTCLITKAFFIY